jgi:lipid-A-disaccharide synthase
MSRDLYPGPRDAGSFLRPSLLVVAGEASGDTLGASVLEAPGASWSAWGLGGPALRAAGASILVDFQRIHANGLGDALRVVPGALAAAGELALEVLHAPPARALLLDATSFNARFGAWLRRRGVLVLWCVAPQLWAWRPDRGPSLARAMDRLAVLFPFEVAPWQALGVSTRWVGHPAIDRPLAPRSVARAALGLLPQTPTLALLPGSRPGELRRLLPPFLDAAARLQGDGVRPFLLLAPSLPAPLVASCERLVKEYGISIVPVDPRRGLGPWLRAFDAALCASGTASLECALAGVKTVISYRVDAVTAWAARRWLRVPWVGLPNLLLGREICPELLQQRCSGPQLAAALRDTLSAASDGALHAEELRDALDPRDGLTVGERVARFLGEGPR